jgi:MFS family permease
MWRSKFRNRPTREVRASVVAPLAVLVVCGLLVLMQLYVAIPLAPWWVRSWAVTVTVLWPLIVASTVFVAGIATVVPALIALIGSRAGSNRGGVLGLGGLALFAGASCGPPAASLSLSFASLLLTIAVLLLVGAALVAISGSPPRPRSRRMTSDR